VLRGKIKAAKDNTIGWIAMAGQDGKSVASVAETLVVKSSVAMTDGRDIQTCKVVRKLEVGEKFTTSSDQVEDGGVMRVKGTAVKDGKEGWCTVKGNKGSVYMESAGGPASKTYTALEECAIMKIFGAGGGSEVRKLAVTRSSR